MNAICWLLFMKTELFWQWKQRDAKRWKRPLKQLISFISSSNLKFQSIKLSCFYRKCKSEGKSGLWIKYFEAKSGIWSLKAGGLLIQVKVILITLGRIWRWSLNTGGLLIQVVFRTGLTVYFVGIVVCKRLGEILCCFKTKTSFYFIVDILLWVYFERYCRFF